MSELCALVGGFSARSLYGKGRALTDNGCAPVTWESYADRKTGAIIARWNGKLADQYHDYARPQESGACVDQQRAVAMRIDVRAVRLGRRLQREVAVREGPIRMATARC
jgi:hypothetical protein